VVLSGNPLQSNWGSASSNIPRIKQISAILDSSGIKQISAILDSSVSRPCVEPLNFVLPVIAIRFPSQLIGS
jgi:hypothetical protein